MCDEQTVDNSWRPFWRSVSANTVEYRNFSFVSLPLRDRSSRSSAHACFIEDSANFLFSWKSLFRTIFLSDENYSFCVIKLAIIEWSWVGYEDVCRSIKEGVVDFNNCFIIHSKYFRIFKGGFAISLIFPLTKNSPISSPGFLGQWFNNMQRAALLTSLFQCDKDSFQIWSTARYRSGTSLQLRPAYGLCLLNWNDINLF